MLFGLEMNFVKDGEKGGKFTLYWSTWFTDLF